MRLRDRLALCAVALLLSGCGLHHLRRAEPFTCRGPERAAPRPSLLPLPQSAATPGRLQLKALDPGPPDAADAGACSPADADCAIASVEPRSAFGRHGKRRLQIVAEAAPLHLFAAKLSEALGVAVVTDPQVADLRISVVAPTITLNALRRVLANAYPLSLREARRDSQVVLFAHRGVESSMDLTVQVLPLHSETPARETARMLCDQILTPRGSLTLVGHALWVKDLPQTFGKIRHAIGVVEHTSEE